MSQKFQNMVAGFFALFGLFAAGGVAGKPALDEYDVKDAGHDDADQQRGKRYHCSTRLQTAAVAVPHSATVSDTHAR